MSSGQKRVVYNTRERVISPDANRAEAFVDAAIAEQSRQRTTQSMVWEDCLFQPIADTVGAPLRGSIAQGLFVVAPLASLELAVVPGLATLIDPDGQVGSTVATPPNPDDSVGKLCFDPVGVTIGSGTLTFTPNVGPGVRVDIVEIQRDPTVVLETDNRDVFNPATGLFVPATVNKVVVDGIRYRIRLGVPGAGIPAMALGWMPIAVITVPAAAPNFDTCVIYDVRPLESDRTSPGSLVGRLAPEISRSFYVDGVTVPGQYRMTARMEGPGALGYWDGGAYFVDLRNVTIREPGFALVANQIVYLWALYPAGLPRWVRYTAVNVPPYGGRIPGNSGRGITCLSTRGPLQLSYAGLVPSAPVLLPPSSGFGPGTPAAFGQLIAALANESGAVSGALANCKRGRMSFANTPAPSIAAVVVPSATFDTVALNYGIEIPYGARGVLVVAGATFTAAVGTAFTYFETVTVQHPTPGGPTYLNEVVQHHVVIPAAGFIDVVFAIWVDLITDYSNVTAALAKQIISVQWAQSGGIIKSAETLTVAGWEL